jgi:hypothetical protein
MRTATPATVLRACLLLVAGAALSAQPLHSQYFGRNNPQFRTFDF